MAEIGKKLSGEYNFAALYLYRSGKNINPECNEEIGSLYTALVFQILITECFETVVEDFRLIFDILASVLLITDGIWM